MITRIELNNFMSHAHTVIEPAAGLTVLVGANNVGKSAVVAALQILCSNDGSTHVMRHGAKQCSVKLETDDGHSIEWRRKTSPSYVIDGQTFDRLKGSGLPDELHRALRLPPVDDANGDDFDVHFGAQKAPIFLLGSSSSNKARFFASSSDAIRLVAIQKRHKEKLTEAQREKVRLEADSRRVNAELELLEPAIEVESRLELLEATHAELVGRNLRFDELSQSERALRAQGVELERLALHADSLADLSPPPDLLAIEPLEQWITLDEAAQKKLESALGSAQALCELAAPPALHDTTQLTQLINNLDGASVAVQAWELVGRSMGQLSPPPLQADSRTLETLVRQIEACAQQQQRAVDCLDALQAVAPAPTLSDPLGIAAFLRSFETAIELSRSCAAEVASASAELSTATDELRAAADGMSCPTCGVPLDPERIIARAATALGGHDHD
jgi:exonuclease SbcC